MQPKLLGSARGGEVGRNQQLLTALNRSYDSASSGGGSVGNASPRVGTTPGVLRPVLQGSRLTDSTAHSSHKAARNGFAAYKYKVSVDQIVAAGNKSDNPFVLPGYYDKLPAPFTNKDKTIVPSMNRDEGKRDFISFY